MTRVFSILALFLIFANALPLAGRADPYRLVQGDRLEVLHSGLATAKSAVIDADGQLRLTDLGGITVAGLTLDEAEQAMAGAMEEAGLYVDPRVSLTVEDYAPVIVAGDVMQPGRQSYMPGMTVAAAVAMSGGSQAAGLTRSEIARARTEATGALRTANLDIAAAVVRLARLQAELDGSELVLDDALRARIPAPSAVDLDTLVTNEGRILDGMRKRAEQLQSFWGQEIETIRAQIVLFEERIEVQQAIVASATDALADARDLQERGLQTSSRLAVAEQREADARSKVLELESAKIAATRAISDAERERVQFLGSARQEALTSEQDTLIAIEAALLRHDRVAEQLALLSGGGSGAALASDAVVVSFELISPRENRTSGLVDPQSALLPGETLVVTVEAMTDELGG